VGRRVVLTRARGAAGDLVARLRADGVEVVECPLIRIEPLGGPELEVAGYDWLVLTSARAVECLDARLRSWGGLPPVAVIGPGTAQALRERGLEPALVASRSTQEGLVEELRLLLAELGRPPRILFPGATGARDVLVRELGADFVPLYRTVEERPADFPQADLVVLASASAARAFAALELDGSCVSIGPVTSEEARRLGLRVVAEAASPDDVGLADAVERGLSHVANRGMEDGAASV
jgi:uroporphyrinogen III methyltransferase / synthase